MCERAEVAGAQQPVPIGMNVELMVDRVTGLEGASDRETRLIPTNDRDITCVSGPQRQENRLEVPHATVELTESDLSDECAVRCL
jgi:hypothetical protein